MSGRTVYNGLRWNHSYTFFFRTVNGNWVKVGTKGVSWELKKRRTARAMRLVGGIVWADCLEIVALPNSTYFAHCWENLNSNFACCDTEDEPLPDALSLASIIIATDNVANFTFYFQHGHKLVSGPPLPESHIIAVFVCVIDSTRGRTVTSIWWSWKWWWKSWGLLRLTLAWRIWSVRWMKTMMASSATERCVCVWCYDQLLENIFWCFHNLFFSPFLESE